jgi:hypothetical protein
MLRTETDSSEPIFPKMIEPAIEEYWGAVAPEGNALSVSITAEDNSEKSIFLFLPDDL